MVLVLMMHRYWLQDMLDWDCIDVAYPASVSDTDGPFVGVGILVGDRDGLLVGLVI